MAYRRRKMKALCSEGEGRAVLIYVEHAWTTRQVGTCALNSLLNSNSSGIKAATTRHLYRRQCDQEV